MHAVQIFVEDELNEAYEILAAKAMGVGVSRSGEARRRRIRAARVTLDELIDFESLLDLVQRAQRSGAEQVVFAIDHEGPRADPGRVAARNRFGEAFRQLCDYIDELPAGHTLKNIRVVRLEIRSCLEAWLLSDPQAIVTAFNGPSDYRPRPQQTERMTPAEASNAIAHIIREVGKRRRVRKMARIRSSGIKSLGLKIASHIDLTQAQRHNRSLAYFCEMIGQNLDGCTRMFPDQ